MILKLRLKFLFSLIICLISLLFIFLILNRLGDSSLFHKTDIIPSDYAEGRVYFDYLTARSPNNHYYAIVSFENYSLYKSELKVVDRFGENKYTIARSDNYSYYTNPIWSPDGKKLAYVMIYPFQIWVSNPDGTDNKQLYAEVDPSKDSDWKVKNLFNPSITKSTKVDISWADSKTLLFKNNYEFPTVTYSIDINTSTISKVTTQVGELKNSPASISVQPLSQRDDKWKDIKLGGCDEDSIGSAGCAITAISMVLNYFGETTTPDKLNDFLNSNSEQGYFDGCAVRWSAATSFSDKIALKGVYFNEFNLDRLKFELQQGNPVIVGWNSVAFTPIQHWALVTKFDPTQKEDLEQFITNDPWTGEEKPLSYFGNNFDHMVVYTKNI